MRVFFWFVLSLHFGNYFCPVFSNSDKAHAVRLNDKGNAAVASGDLIGALEHYENASVHFSTNAAIRSNVLSTLVKLGRPFEAVLKGMDYGLLNETDLLGEDIVRTENDRKRLLEKRKAQRKTNRDLSVYGVLGVALHNIHRLDMAVLSFRQALFENEKDGVTWVNLGETLLHQRRAGFAIWAFENALLVHRVSSDFSVLLKARSWICDWRDRETLEAIVQEAFRNGTTKIRATGDFINVQASDMLKQNKMLWPKSRETPRLTNPSVRSVLINRWSARDDSSSKTDVPRLRVGLLTADFGVHPVSSLIRGFFFF